MLGGAEILWVVYCKLNWQFLDWDIVYFMIVDRKLILELIYGMFVWVLSAGGEVFWSFCPLFVLLRQHFSETHPISFLAENSRSYSPNTVRGHQLIIITLINSYSGRP